MTAVFVHGVPETSRIWDPLRRSIDRHSIALALPGFGNERPDGFGATKDEYADWLAESLRELGGPIDVVGHDWGALLTLRVATAYDVPLRSWAVDVADIFHPDFVWHETAQIWQTPGAGEERMRALHEEAGFAARLEGVGVPSALAEAIAAEHDEAMSRCILDLYRSAAPNVAADWGAAAERPTVAPGLVLLLPDPPEVEARSLDTARRLGARTARLDADHCWMAEAPEASAAVLNRFWSSLA
ncbi:MAG TPA: alpha/beta hydrolase [Gaiellaceae bacterium]|jgi:pimeloyl-ACP methyl ester carboxylesterase|nr:alpha/beta hydrolase [Gaiellaceae bacterium]